MLLSHGLLMVKSANKPTIYYAGAKSSYITTFNSMHCIVEYSDIILNKRQCLQQDIKTCVYTRIHAHTSVYQIGVFTYTLSLQCIRYVYLRKHTVYQTGVITYITHTSLYQTGVVTRTHTHTLQ